MKIPIISTALVAVASCSMAAGLAGITWSWGPILPIDKTCRATAVANDSIVTVGGTRWEPGKDGRTIKQWLSTAYVLDGGINRWRQLPDYPKPSGYAFAAGIGSRIYVVGGRGAGAGNAEVFTLDLSKPECKWEAGPKLPKPRWEHTGGVWNNTIYIAGGSEGDPSTESGHRLAPSVYALNTLMPDKGWRHIADYPNPSIMYPVTAVCGSKLFLFGGAVMDPDGSTFLPRTEAYCLDLETAKWSQLNPLPESAFSGACVAISDGHILIAGGLTSIPGHLSPDGKPRSQMSNKCFIYDVLKGTYSSATGLIEGVGDEGLVALNGSVYCVGGEQTTLKTRTDVVQIGKILATP